MIHLLLQESGVKFEDEELTQGGQLCSILYEYDDLKAAFEGSSQDCEARERRAAEEELLSMPLTPSFPSRLETSIESLHAGNIIACRINSDGTLIASGGADRAIKVICNETFRYIETIPIAKAAQMTVERRELRGITTHTAPILSLAWCPADRFSAEKLTFQTATSAHFLCFHAVKAEPEVPNQQARTLISALNRLCAKWNVRILPFARTPSHTRGRAHAARAHTPQRAALVHRDGRQGAPPRRPLRRNRPGPGGPHQVSERRCGLCESDEQEEGREQRREAYAVRCTQVTMEH